MTEEGQSTFSEKFALDTSSEAVEEIRQRRASVAGDLMDRISASQEAFERISSIEDLGEATEELSKLDAAIRGSIEYQRSVASIAHAINADIRKYSGVSTNFGDFQGRESLYHVLGKVIKPLGRRAHDLRDARIQEQTPEETIDLMVEKTAQLGVQLVKIREEGLQQEEALVHSTDLVTKKIAEYQPIVSEREQTWKALDAELRELRDALTSADEQEQAKLDEKIADKLKEVSEANHAYRQAFTVYRTAKETIDMNRNSLMAFDEANVAIGELIVTVRELPENLCEVYNAATTSTRVALMVKGASTVVEGHKALGRESMDRTLANLEGILDETASLRESEVATPDELMQYKERLIGSIDEDIRRLQAVRDRVDTPFEQRLAEVYAKNAPASESAAPAGAY